MSIQLRMQSTEKAKTSKAKQLISSQPADAVSEAEAGTVMLRGT